MGEAESAEGSDRATGAPLSRIATGLRELRAAAAYLSLGPLTSPNPEDVARGGAFFPLLGLVFGGLAWAVACALPGSADSPAAAAAAAVATLSLLGGAALPRGLARAAAALSSPRAKTASAVATRGAWALGVTVAAASTFAKGWALFQTPPQAQGLSLALAVMLGRWAFVVQAYGSKPAAPEGIGAVFTRAMQFREFGLASVSAMALTLILANAIGLVLILWTATQTILVRIVVHARARGVSEPSLAAGADLAELSTLLLCAGLARAILAG